MMAIGRWLVGLVLCAGVWASGAAASSDEGGGLDEHGKESGVASPAIADEMLTTNELPGFYLDREGEVQDPLLETDSPFFDTVRDQLVIGSWERTWQSVDSTSGVRIGLVDFRNEEAARALARPRGEEDPDPPRLPEGGVSTRTAAVTGDFSQRSALFFVGRTAVRIDVYSALDGADERCRDLLAMTAAVQAAKVTPKPDLPGDTLETSALGWAFNVTLINALIGIPLLIGIGASLIDPAVYGRLTARFLGRPSIPPHAVDVDRGAQRLLARHRLRIALRYVVVIVAYVVSIVGLRWFEAAGPRVVLELLLFGMVLALWSRVERRIPGLRTRAVAQPRLFRGPSAVLSAVGVGAAAALVVLGMLFGFLGQSAALIGLPDAGEEQLRAGRAFFMVVGVIVASLSIVPLTLVRRLAMRRMTQDAEEDTRQCVLLLRSFADDGIRLRAHRTGRTSLLDRFSLRRWDRFEEVVAAELGKVGPVIALSDPNLRLPPPLGATRRAFRSDDWGEGVRQLADQAALVAVNVGRTPALRWEIQELQGRGALSRTVFLIPPASGQDQRMRLHALADALRIDPGLLDYDQRGLKVLAVVVRDPAFPTLFTSAARDDVSYEEAIRVAQALIAGTSDAPAPIRDALPLPVSLRRPPPSGGPLIYPPGRAPRVKPWYRRPSIALIILAWPVIVLLKLVVASSGPPPPPLIATLDLGGTATAFATHGDDLYIVVDGHTLVRYDVAADQVSRLHTFDAAVSEIAADDRGIVFASRVTGEVGAVTPDGQQAWHTDIGRSARGLVVATEPDAVLATSPSESAVVELDRAGGHTLASIDLDGVPWDLAAVGDGKFGVGLANGDEMIVLQAGQDRLSVTGRHTTAPGARELHTTSAGIWAVGNPRGEIVLLDPQTLEPAWSTSVPPAELYAASDTEHLLLRTDGGDAWLYEGRRSERLHLNGDFIALTIDPLGRIVVANPGAAVEIRSLEGNER